MEMLDLSLNATGDNGVLCLLSCLDKVKRLNLKHCGASPEGVSYLKKQLQTLGLPGSLCLGSTTFFL